MSAVQSGIEAFRTMFRSLRYRNYRLFFTGQTISLVGTWMQMMALGWLVYRLTNDKFLLGLVPFCGQLPTFVLTPLTGVWADRFDRRRTIITTQSLMMVQALLLAWLTIEGGITILQIMALSAVLGIISAFDTPSRQAFVVEMVEDKRDLSNAIALNSSMVNCARLIGPAVAGWMVKILGEGYCFLANGLSYIAVVVVLLAMTPTPARPKRPSKHAMHEFRDGLAYAWRFLPIRMVLLLLAVVSLLGSSIMAMAPVFAKDILHGDAKTLGYLMAASGVGALVGAAHLATRRGAMGLIELVAAAAGIFGAGLVAFSFSHTLWISLILMLFTGFGLMVQVAASNTVLQTIVDDDKRGRIMALWAMCFMGMSPFGNLLAGSLGQWLGAPEAVRISGVGCVMATLLFLGMMPALRRGIHEALVQMGLAAQLDVVEPAQPAPAGESDS